MMFFDFEKLIHRKFSFLLPSLMRNSRPKLVFLVEKFLIGTIFAEKVNQDFIRALLTSARLEYYFDEI